MLLSIEGLIEGSINGAPVKARASGNVDTTGNKLNHFNLEMIDNPGDANPIVAGNCWNSSYHGNGFLPILSARQVKNIFEMSVGGYVSSRSVSYPTLGPDNYLKLLSDVSISGEIIRTNSASVEGFYNGPRDAIGIDSPRLVWRKSGDNSVTILTTANIQLSSGDILPVEIETIYGNLGRGVTFDEAAGLIVYGNQTWDGRNMSFDWVGVMY